MIITAISTQKCNENRVNVSIDGKYRFSLDICQLIELSIKVGNDYSEQEIAKFENESQFGKTYNRTLEYCFVRPHSAREIKDYLYRKTRPTLTKDGKIKPGITSDIAERVFDRLKQKGYIDDVKFASLWIENRSLRKGSSRKKLIYELRLKGVEGSTIDKVLAETSRDDDIEVQKIIDKKKCRYPDVNKLTAYLARQGFSYETIKRALSQND